MVYNKKEQRNLESLQKDLIRAEELYDLGQFEETFKISDRVYQDSLVLNNNLLAFDAIIFKVTIPIQLGNLDKVPDLINQAENLLQIMSGDSLKEVELKKIDLLSLKGQLSFTKGEYGNSVEIHKKVLKMQEKFGDKKKLARTLDFIGDSMALGGEVEDSIPYFQQSLILCEELNLKSIKARILIAFNAICLVSGKIERSLYYINKSLEISEEINHKPLIALALNNLGALYREMGDLDGAMNAWERSLEISEEIGFEYMKTAVLDFIIQAAIENGDRQKAENCLKTLKEIDERKKTKHSHLIYLLNKALVLKLSLRAHDRAESEDLLKQISKERGYGLEIRITALLNLCDLLIKELQITGYIEILDELQNYIDELLSIVEKRQSYLYIAETYLLQARISLLSFNLKESRRYFTQAQQIAEQWRLTQLSLKIAKEKEEFLRQMKKWENYKEKNVPLNERLELAQLDKQIERMLHNRAELTGQVIEEKVEVHKERKICMICKGDVSRYIYVCDCDTIYCENCVKALIGLENACWVCETPIDQSKPIKHFKKDEVEIKKKTLEKKINMTEKIDIDVGVATIEDAQGILNALKQNLIEIRDVDEISQKQRKILEDEGYLRKEVDIEYYKNLIEDTSTDIYIAKNNTGRIIGFASIHRKKYDIVKVRDVIGNVSFENEKTKDLLLNEEKEFEYLDQVSILPECKRKGVGTLIFQEALSNLTAPIVAFIVEKPVFNKASVYWHEHNGFKLQGISDGEYKGKSFKFLIYINWNNTY